MAGFPITRMRIVNLFADCDHGLTLDQIMERLPDMKRRTVMSAIWATLQLKEDDRVLYVADWLRSVGRSGPMFAVYRAGSLPDAEKPIIDARGDAWKRYNAKKYARNRAAKSLSPRAAVFEPGRSVMISMVIPVKPIEIPPGSTVLFTLKTLRGPSKK